MRRHPDKLVLCYHAISEDWPELYAVRASALEQQLRHLLARGYAGATFAELVVAPPQARVFAATFDDAYRSVRDRALPILSRLGVPGTVFACSNFATEGGRLDLVDGRWLGSAHEAELDGMNWSDLGELLDAGWEVGSHTRSHPVLTSVDERTLADELGASRLACESRLGRPCRSLAYPYGGYDGRVATAARAAGYEQAATLFPGRLNDPPRLEWPRVAINRHHDLRGFRLKVSATARTLRTSEPSARVIEALMRRRGRSPTRRPRGPTV